MMVVLSIHAIISGEESINGILSEQGPTPLSNGNPMIESASKAHNDSDTLATSPTNKQVSIHLPKTARFLQDSDTLATSPTNENINTHLPSYDPSNNNNISMIVFTHSKPAGKEARDLQREFCQPLYKHHGVRHVFAVGKPSFDERPRDQKVQGQLATDKEVNISNMLMQEHEQYGDLLITPNRDYYRDKSEKLLVSIRYSISQGVDYVLKTDDEYCINITEVKRLVAERSNKTDELYLGVNRFSGKEYNSMKGHNGTVAPFMSGVVFGLSRKLAKVIAEDGWVHNILVAPYGTSSDDANLGKWVDWAIRTHNLTVDYVVSRKLKIDVPGMKHTKKEINDSIKSEDPPAKVNCGSHRSLSCAECGKGASWCNGQCKWSEGKCQAKSSLNVGTVTKSSGPVQEPKVLQSSANLTGPSSNKTLSNSTGLFVISLQGTRGAHKSNNNRLDIFKTKWEKACGPSFLSQMEHCPGVLDSRRGYGVTKSNIRCLEKARGTNLEMIIILEDDARLFDRSTVDFCQADRRNKAYWDSLPADAFIAFLGGHSWQYPKSDPNATSQRFREVSFNYGAYGYAVHRRNLELLIAEMEGWISQGSGSVHPELAMYKSARKYHLKNYAVDPLVVWHEAGFSNTWKKNRGDIMGDESNKGRNSPLGISDYVSAAASAITTNIEKDSLPHIVGVTKDPFNDEGCLDSLNLRAQEMKTQFALAQAKMNAEYKWARAAGLMSSSDDVTQQIDCQLFRHSLEDKRIIYFLHIHKAGGTHFCAAARANHFFANFEENCNAHVDTCTDPRLGIGNHTGLFHFVANEWPLCSDMDPIKYRYVVQLRKSASRYKSDYITAAGSKSLQSWLQVQPDNFSTRMICGHQCLARPKFQLTLEDFVYTLKRLARFDNIVLLEDYERTFGKFASEVGWRYNTGVKNTPYTEARKKVLSQSSKQAVNDYVISDSYTILDDALYEFALAKIQDGNMSMSSGVQERLNAYFSVQTNSNCTTPCCDSCEFHFRWGQHLGDLFSSVVATST